MEKILIAEDDQGIRIGINYLLTNQGYEIREARNGNEALEILKNEKFDLILSDVMMPGKNGYELLEEIRKDNTLSSTPFLFLTAKTAYEDYRKGMNLGVDDFITKPFKADELLQAIITQLNKKNNIEEKFDNLKTGITKYIPHELRTPLLSILGYSDFILSDFKDETPEIVIEMIERINVAGNRLQRTIEKFLIFTQLKSEINFSGNYPSFENYPDFSIARIFENVKIKLEKIYSNNVTFKTSINEKLLNISEHYFEILLTELLDNAVKFSSTNGVVILNTRTLNNFYQIEIINEGVEFTENQISRISEFMQFNRDKLQQNGNGLGLTIVKNILTIVNGSIEISSNNNLSKVIIMIPQKVE